MIVRFGLAFGLWAALVGFSRSNFAAAQTAYPPTTPFLRIETGMHTAPITRIDIDAAERFLVTASDDKTARVWDLKTGTLLQILRPPEGTGSEGMLYAVAISPDGATVAVAGLTGPDSGPWSVYLFDRASGTLTHTIPGSPGVINHLSYSLDGRYLAVALGRSSGIRVYRAPDYTEASRDSGYGDSCDWVEFDRTGRLVTTSRDGFLRLYNQGSQLIAKKKAPAGTRPFSARFSPDGSKIAVGFQDTTAVSILSGRDLAFLSAPQTPSGGGSLANVAWSHDGYTLYAGGTYAAELRVIASWLNARGEPAYWPAARSTIMEIRTLSDGRVIFGAQDPAVGVLDRAGRVLWQHSAEVLDYRTPAGLVNLSPEGVIAEFRFLVTSESRCGRFDLTRRQMALNVSADSTLTGPRTTGLGIKDWDGTTQPTLNGDALPLDSYERSRSLAISAKADTFLLGSEWHLRLFESAGHLLWQTPTPGVAWAVNLTPDGQFAVSALGDGTIRWYHTTNGQEVMALFADPDGKRWILWTPEGFYDSSENADSLIGYHLNHGPDHEGEFVHVEQLKQLFYRPDLLAQRLKPESDKLFSEALNQIGDVSAILHSGSPPELALLSPPESDSDNGQFTLQFKITDHGAGHGRLVYRIDGQEMEGRTIAPTGGKNTDTVSLLFNLPPGRHTLSASAYNGAGKLESRSISSVVNVRQPQQRPALYVLAVGISNYRDHSLNPGVKFAANDADIIAARLKQQGTGLFREVTTYVLKDANASRDNIEKTAAQIAATIGPADEFVFYLAGHGTAINGEYTFVPWNAIYSGSDALHDQSLNEERLQNLLKSIPASKTLLLLDTCSAGSAIAGRDPILSEKGSIERLSKLTGRATIAASSSDQMALEGYDNHGVFTSALLEGLITAVDKAGLIQVSTLADYVEERVPAITRQRWGYEQFPMRLITGQTFPIAKKQSP
jgi:WD40 repeat protein